MKPTLPAILLLSILAALAPVGAAKDQPIDIAKCPAPVQAVLRHYSTQGTLESVALDEKKKTGGPPVYEAKFSLPDGKRVEVHISPDGKVVHREEKKPKS